MAITSEWIDHRYSAERDFDEGFDTIIVLGSGIAFDGILTFSGRRRTYTAVWLQQRGVTDKIIFSAGKSRSGYIISEKMRDLAIEHGAEPESITVEASARTTWENLRFTYDLAQPSQQKIGLLTDASHMARALVLNAYLGGPDVVPISTPQPLSLTTRRGVLEITREALAWWYNLGKIAAWEVSGWLGYTEEERGKFIF